ncbi:glycosyltransferase [Desulfurobacterium thermolithotrophum]|uniref:glycosyltransferase n=1 Tax=Desulfurobacterium thermolithotrophum TaxID=64160 RepID=UPI0013D80780|nr:glycosyltransferase [Desulfurobacterium thermolithotrophum]
MKIAIFTDNFRKDMGGGTKVILDLAQGLKEMGHEVLIVTGQSVDDSARNFNVLRLPSIRCPLYDNAEVILPCLELIRVLKEFDPHLIHYHEPFTAGMIALVVSKYLKKKVVGTIHIDPLHLSQYTFKVDNGSVAKMLVGFMSRQSDAMVFVSQYQKQTYYPFLKKNGDYAVIYPGIPDCFFFKETPVFGKRVITVSRLASEKNLEFAFKVMAVVQKKTNVDYYVVGDGPKRKKLENYARALGLKVSFLGNVEREKLPKLYSSSSVFFLPSKTETFGLVFAEAMACGLPVVALNEGSAPEVVGHGGIICNEKVEEVAGAIVSLLNKKSFWMEKSDKAKSRASQFKKNRFIEEHIEFYRKIL